MIKSEYKIKDVEKLGVTKAQLREWVKLGYIVPCVRKRRGEGLPNIYSYRNMCEIFIFKSLFNLGFTRKASHSIVRRMDRQNPLHLDIVKLKLMGVPSIEIEIEDPGHIIEVLFNK